MPELVRLYIRHVAIGLLISVAFVGLLLGTNVANLRHLVFGSSGGWIAVPMLIVGNGVVFAGVQFAIAVMGLAEDDGPRGGRRNPLRAIISALRWPSSPAARPLPVRHTDR